jgi:hypothetical protein
MFFSLEMPRGRPETTGLYSVKRRRARPFLCRRNAAARPKSGNRFLEGITPGPGITETGIRIIYSPPPPHYPGIDP